MRKHFARSTPAVSPPKGQLISKCLFSVFKFFQKKRTKTSWPEVKLNFLIRFLEELRIPKSPFEINWPLFSHSEDFVSTKLFCLDTFEESFSDKIFFQIMVIPEIEIIYKLALLMQWNAVDWKIIIVHTYYNLIQIQSKNREPNFLLYEKGGKWILSAYLHEWIKRSSIKSGN